MKKIISGDGVGQRLDVVVHNILEGVSRSSAQKLCDQGKVTVNGSIGKAGQKLRAGDRISVDYDPERDSKIPEISLDIVYIDDDCIVLNKPTGVLTHSKGEFYPEGTVATFISPYVTGLSGNRAGIVHRLDRHTSGVIIAARNSEALSWLQKQFSQRRVKKEYVAIVAGRPNPDRAVIDMPIMRNPKKPQTFTTSPHGKPAITEYEVLLSNQTHSKVLLRPITGRTHQLRVHLSRLGNPIAGDTLYGGTPEERMMLHAQKLELTLPSRERKVFEAPLPEAFDRIMKA